MNRIYKLKFDKRRNELVVVSEITAGMGKEKSTGHIADLSALSLFRKLPGTLTPVALLTGFIISLFPGMALAADLPTGGQIVGGQGSISTSGSQMTIHQQTQNMATNWHSFDIGRNNTVQFVQPDSSAVALNRVTGASGSQIMGTLKANGQVFILNPNGVLFGKGARVNVGGLVASTKNLSTADFMNGQYTLSGSGNPGAQVVNQGSLTTSKGGYIVLAGERVSNSGTVITPSGKTVLAAGKTVTLQLDEGGLTSVSVNGSVVNALVENRGLISASNGQVYLTAKGQDMLLNTVVNNSGTVEAKGLASRGGEIVLSGGDNGVVSQSGQLLADSQTGRGGKITLEGQNIHLAGGSLASATGKTGGGEVYAGGGWQGKDSRIRNASKVVMDKAATVDVSATENGHGGTAVLWSDDYTNFRGTVLAKGGAQSGSGGQVETSSHRNLQASGTVDASARAGRGGEWLLDPTDVTIVGTGADTGIGSATADGTGIFTPTATGAQILGTSIESQLNAGTNVTVRTSGADTAGQTGNITVNANITKSAGADATLTLLADNNISTGDRVSIGASAGKLNLNLLAGNTTNNASISLGNFINISLNGGDFLADAGNADSRISLTYRNNGQIQGGNVTLNVSRGLSGYAYRVQADNDLTINGPVTGSTGWGALLGFTAGGRLAMNSPGSISLKANETANGGGRLLISGDKGVSLNAADGGVTLQAASSAQNGANITSANGPVSISGMRQDGSDTLTLTNVNISSGGDTTLNGTTYWGKAVVLSGVNISSGGDVGISGFAKNLAIGNLGAASSLGVKLSGSNISADSGNVTLTGAAGTNPAHTSISSLEVSNSTVSAGHVITLNGTTDTNTGVKVTGSTLQASALNISGVANVRGTGFSLATSQLLGGLADLTNVTLSSAGSAAGALNSLDGSIVNDATRDTLLAKRIENMTTVEMGGQAIFDDTTKAEKGWTQDYSLADLPNHGWIFSNTSVTAGGDVNLKGAGFTNSAVTVTNGNLSIDNSGPVPLSGTTLTVNDGAVNLHAGAGTIDLGKANISAKGDITLKADAGSIAISGTNATVKANLTSAEGNITVDGVASSKELGGLELRDVSISATQGRITVTGSSAFDSPQSIYIGEQVGAVVIAGSVSFESLSNILNARNTWVSGDVAQVKQMPATALLFKYNSSLFMEGTSFVNAHASAGAGIVFDSYDVPSSNTISIANGDLHINASTGDAPQTNTTAVGAVTINNTYTSIPVYIVLDNANVTIEADASGATNNRVYGFAASSWGATSTRHSNGFVFKGSGNVIVKGKAAKGDGVNARLLNNTGLSGSFSVQGESDSGNGVSFDGGVNAALVGAEIIGESKSGAGIAISAWHQAAKGADLRGSILNGISETGAGIQLTGNNITLTSGTLTGTATSGNGSGV
ncbi:filamentous hemagglutinin N-terminal domain-containing protein, partial [Salmonella enterica]|nr:filamentous hemagglutinin N-terminal domain-containing protein [Salmonella enterica]EBA3159882.1 filamentous hemagglutinin N-terminal domain-containing protein [Salmonella enterica]EBP8612853.1 filamentous hemagglutinin N-terminal domain-containing protein [Salmonella enterica]